MIQVLEKLLKVVDTLESWIEEFPPIDQPQRFGNKAFRDWFGKLKEVTPVYSLEYVIKINPFPRHS